MAKLKLKDETLTLKLDYDAIEELEEHFDKDIITIVDEIDVRQKHLVKIISAMTINTDELEPSDVRERFKSLTESGEFDYKQIMEGIAHATKESTIFKKMLTSKNKTAPKESA